MIAATKQYKTAPLPFNGQKRAFVAPFRKALEKYPKNAIYVDLFGGSGLLSHTIKSIYPAATVVYNDFDNYAKRLLNVATTNEILARIREITKNLPQEERISQNCKSAILDVLKAAEKQGKYIDFITICNSILFTINVYFSIAELEKQVFYNNVVKKEYNTAGYLEGLTIVREDYKILIDKYKDVSNVIFVCDPPYLSTDVAAYKCYWKLTDYLEIIRKLDKQSFFYFTSSKSQIIELCEWLGNVSNFNLFENATIENVVKTGKNVNYTDSMIWKIK